ncbi:MAG: alpha-amylase [Treponema sp.]|jgi:glycosidase|nr:alpha-amylase [Treponema sp.]
MISHLSNRVFYHIYPFGFCGTPRYNDFSCPAGTGLRSLIGHIPHLLDLGVNAVYIGPLFESTAHGYDTLDYYHVDRRLGNNEALRDLVKVFHDAGILVILDGVLNHTGRHFFAFRDVREKGQYSAYRDWFSGLNFGGRNPLGDPFTYNTWSGAWDLVKLNGVHREVREHLFGAVKFWIEEFDIDGLRLDAADQLLPDFMDELSQRSKAIKDDFWLMGEVVHGNYRNWARTGRLDSVTNYELYKGLWSSFNDRNFFELAWTLNRQSGPEGMYRDLLLYNFADNHDVNRVASILKNPAHLFPLYGLLFTIPGIPSIYYGSELGLRGERANNQDFSLRPAWADLPENFPLENKPVVDSGKLTGAIRRFGTIRKQYAALQEGSYRELFKGHGQFAFLRELKNNTDAAQGIIVAINADMRTEHIHIPAASLGMHGTRWHDVLNGGEWRNGDRGLDVQIDPSWLRILVRR